MSMAGQLRSNDHSLADVHASVGTGQVSFWKRMFAFAGPAYLVSVGYMDPGNWATDLEGGARFGYRLLWVLVMSNAMAILLQTLSARLGIVSGRDLAQACRETYPRRINMVLWGLCEVAIAACDLAEVLGAAIGLNLLFHLPLLYGVLITAADTLLVLWFQSFGIRMIEAFVLSLIAVMAACFCIEIFWAKPGWGEMVTGLVPRLNGESLYIAIGILGATVMPHNLYLHSALVQTRNIGQTEAAKRTACRYNLIDSVVALNGAMFVNTAILVLAAAVFFRRGIIVTEIQQAQVLLVPLLGTSVAGVIFAVALLCSGQSSTLTGTLAGQVVMEGYLNFRMRPWLRRLITRSLAIVPAALTIYIAGDQASFGLIILSQVLLSMQLPFAIIPLIHFTNDRARMGAFANRAWVRVLAWTTALIVVGLNILLAIPVISGWLVAAGPWKPLVWALTVPTGIGLLVLLAFVTFEPMMTRRKLGMAPVTVPETTAAEAAAVPRYHSILVPLDHTELDQLAINHAAAMARIYGAKIFLLHVEEGVTSQIYGGASATAEVELGQQYLDRIAQALKEQAIAVETSISHSTSPTREIIRYAREVKPDLVIMGAHGHGGLKDLIFGNTINPVRHHLTVPMLIVRPGKT
ncbi:MAG TPA: Nramp family divalent metal transporter [Candidatus Sulfopaludibacter sp.]|jgi:manganese transport protein|nr:Nramp family divalent metal transporter [Candidatus Sulfopaludibacter sp.]